MVIDNGATDDTKVVSLSYKDRILNFSYHYCAEPGLMSARHMGCDKAKGDILCYLDDDSLVTKEWLQGVAESFSSNDVVIAGGPCIPEYEATPPEWVEYFASETAYGKINGFLSLVDFGNEFKLVLPVHIYGCNFSIRKSAFLENGGTFPDYYPPGMYQYIGDGESGLSFKLQRKGFLAAYNPKARIDHLIPSSRLTLGYFCWRRYYNGIHASYHDVRMQHGLDGHKAAGGPISVLAQTIQLPLRRIKRYALGLLRTSGFFYATAPTGPPEVVAMKRKTEESFHAGYAFHQKSLKTDPKLLEWVLRENYLGRNGKLPE